MPDDLAVQLPLLKEWLEYMGYAVLGVENYEADDILGTLANACKNGDECIIATGDRDSFQLVSDKVTVLNTVTKMGKPEIIRYDKTAIFEKYGVEPSGMIEIKALQGDTSDNIPGAAGIGEKTATELIAKYHDIDNIYENIDTLDIRESVKTKLIASRDNVYMSRTLGTIFLDVPSISHDYSAYIKTDGDREKLTALMTKLEFFKLMERMGIDFTSVPKKTEEISSFSVIPFEKNAGNYDAVIADNKLYVAKDGKISVLNEKEDIKAFFEDESIEKNIYDLKSAWHYSINNGIELKNVTFDGMLAAYLINPSAKSYEIDRLSAEYSIGAEVDEEYKKIALYSALSKELKRKICDDGEEKLLSDIELPLAKVLAFMEHYGFSVDADGIREMGERLSEKLSDLEKNIYFSAGEEFNINSPKQLGVILFEKLGLPAKKKTKSGYSTGAEILDSLVDFHPIIGMILEYRKLAKLKSTYCDGLITTVADDGKIHSTFNQTETRTGRISSLEPNLQNIPVRTKEGRELRKYFVAADGYTLVDADYSQIELRVLACMANDEKMTEAFKNGIDIHTLTASEVFKIPTSMVTDTMRRNAKAVNFGIVYGIGAFSLAKDIGSTRKEASDYINGYLSTYSGVDKFMKTSVENAKKCGYSETLFGRKRYLPELTASNAMVRAAGERIARNMPIQGTAADIIKIAMVKVFERLEREKLDAKLIMQVHDELIVEAKEDIAEYVGKLLSEEMQNAVKLAVPFVADTHIGKSWYEAKE